MTFPRLIKTCVVLAAFFAGTGLASAQIGQVSAPEAWVDSPMYKDPDLTSPGVEDILPKGTLELWMKALEQPKTDLRIKAATAITMAHRRGIKGMAAAIPNLIAALDQKDQPPTVVLALVKALIVLDARKAAPNLYARLSTAGNDLREVIEPALTRWDHQAVRADWLKRLGAPGTETSAQSGTRSLTLAIRGLGAVRETQALEPMRELLFAASTPGPLRLEVARALGQIRKEGAEKDAARLVENPRYGLSGRLGAAAMLRQHQSAEAVGQLKKLATDPEPSVVAAACVRLLEIDPQHAVGVRDALLGSKDPVVRSQGVEVLLKVVSEDSLPKLVARLDDPHPEVRIRARKALFQLAAQKKRDEVIDRVSKAIDGASWRVQEQAIILLTDLNHKVAASRFLPLLSADRPEVFLTAACGLRKLGEPSSFAGALSYLDAEYRRATSLKTLPNRKRVNPGFIDNQIAQLAQMMGQQKYQPAIPILSKMAPRGPTLVYLESRAAAIWALSLLHEVKSVASLREVFDARLRDTLSLPPEDNRVRQMSAIALARIKDKESLPTFRMFFSSAELGEDTVANACIWATRQLEGGAMPPRKAVQRLTRNWFITPND